MMTGTQLRIDWVETAWTPPAHHRRREPLDEYGFGAMRAGSSGFLLKGGEPGELLPAIRTVAARESLLRPA